MMNSIPNRERSIFQQAFAVTLSILSWAFIGFQFYIAEVSIINFFSYFTILSNLLIAICLTLSVLAPDTRLGNICANLSVQSAIATYIFIVFLVYNLVLRGIVALSGFAALVDNMLHVVIPILYILYWLLFRPKGILKWANVIPWAIFPFVYLVYSFIRGSIVHWYPYPFLNALKFGYGQVFLNIIVILAVFLLFGFIFIFITRLKKKEST